METFNCVPNVAKTKSRPNLTGNFYHNVPRTLRPIAGSEYAVPNCTGRRTTPSITHPWQERPPPTPISCIGFEKKTSKGKLCSIALAVASFVVLVAVLAIAGLALYMGVLHTETPNALLTFSCNAKVSRGDRFVGGLQDKARRYERQFELLYQRSILGPALVSCVVDKFGNDTLTIYYRLTFNRMRISKNVSDIEKAIKDILLADAISRQSIFKNVRFDPRHVIVRQAISNDIIQPSVTISSSRILPSDRKNNIFATKPNDALKPKPNKSHHFSPTKRPLINEDFINIEDEDLPVIQGSFKISKTEADITEKKTEVSSAKPKIEKTTISFIKKTMLKEAAVTSALYKIAAVEKVTKRTDSTTIPTTIRTSTTTTTTTTSTPTPKTETTSMTSSVDPVFIINPFDDAPWIPILNMSPESPEKPNQDLAHKQFHLNPTSSPLPGGQPTYTSFTNPNFNFNEAERLGSTSLRSHPIPVNKIPEDAAKEMTKEIEVPLSEESYKKFVEVVTVNYIPERDVAKAPMLLNISSIFHTLASTIVNHSLSQDDRTKESESVFGQGQVEVVVDDIDDLMFHTTKHPLVTLLPAKSNSGIGRPVRKRPFESAESKVLVENRNFPNRPSFGNHDDDKGNKEDLTITSTLNFAPEDSIEKGQSDIIRYPKMDIEVSLRKPLGLEEGQAAALPNNMNNNSNILTREEIEQLSEISRIIDNTTRFSQEPGISNKAVSSSYLNGIPILSKPMNKIELPTNDNYYNGNTSDCTKSSVVCGDGRCLPETTKCNQLIDCTDGKDEQNCNCADYLRSQYLLGKICDGVVDCWDYSDENMCEWCHPNQYVCSNSKVCIDKDKICDGVKNCPQGDDERQCVTIAADIESADTFPYYSEGYLMVRKYGEWGKLCIDNFENVVTLSHIAWQVPDLGKAVCKSMTYQKMASIRTVTEHQNEKNESHYFELTYSFQKETKSNISFTRSTCSDKKTVKVECHSLECGTRPQIIKHIARVVGGGNAGLGAWPWQAALYKEGEFQCGATLLSNRWLVSAGHCFYHSQEEYWVVRLGALRRGTSLPSPYEQLRRVSRIIVHPGYVDSGFINDISLLQLESPVVFSDYVRPVCLPQPNQGPVDGGLCTIIGWGQLFEVGRIFPDTLQEVQVPIISTGECRKRTLFLSLYKITEDMFCAGYDRGGRDACLGDSGGPLMCPESNGRWTLQGITSNGYGCARANRPGVYTKVANYVEWIHFNMKNEEATSETASANATLKDGCSGHRCPLGECLPESRLCNGYIECSDGSDETHCEHQKS